MQTPQAGCTVLWVFHKFAIKNGIKPVKNFVFFGVFHRFDAILASLRFLCDFAKLSLEKGNYAEIICGSRYILW